ncbi:hypothetical protein FBR43_07770 [Sphingomonas baiyangensis]|uniref:Uncharacterized protein n=2 Tax=Sphingomonas baiyangensis TaxID=2572576 RepID=A0A4U1L5G0_9SPHN|nr:hypothetical protein FBR43_07770 [Sphingomonas baiyangensis]
MQQAIWPQQPLWGAVVALLVVAVASGWADRRRAKRDDWNRVGLLPLPLVHMLALIGAFLLALLALRG